MKRNLFFNLACLALAVLFSCGGDDDKKSSARYFIKFKMDGEWKTFETNEPGYQSCGDCACSSIPPLEDDYADLNVCNDDNDWITKADIEGWANVDIDFSGGFPIASFYFVEDGVFYSTEFADQATSVMEIATVALDGLFGGTLQQYRVKGTFQCTVRADGDDTDIEITEGSFTVRYSED